MKKLYALFMSTIISISAVGSCFANSNVVDVNIFMDPVQATYSGMPNVTATIDNLNFSDVDSSHWASPAIVKAGAFNMVKGYNNYYNPSDYVTNQEALAFILRAIGLEDDSQIAGEEIVDIIGMGASGILNMWAVGYLTMAQQIGLISALEYEQATNLGLIEEEPLVETPIEDEAGTEYDYLNQMYLEKNIFDADEPATRERVIDWLIDAINSIASPTLIQNEQQIIYNYSDWEDVNFIYMDNMEIALDNGIIQGVGDKINPQGYITRAEFAQILSNMDNIYYSATGLTKKTGTIYGIQDSQTTQTGSASLERDIYIRNEFGEVDVLKYSVAVSTSPIDDILDAVVYNMNGLVTGLGALKEGYQIEYIVDEGQKDVKFVSVKSESIVTNYANGKLISLDFDDNLIQITDNNDKLYNYYLRDGMIGQDDDGDYIYIDGIRRRSDEVPYGSMFQLELQNNGVANIKFVGHYNLTSEVTGIVLENNTDYGYIALMTSSGEEIVKSYFADDVFVEKQPHYTDADAVGYIDQIFPNFQYDIRDTTIDEIEIGDTVVIRSKSDDLNYIDQISAKTNYSIKEGKIVELADSEAYFTASVQDNSGLVSIYEIPKSISVTKGGTPVNTYEIMTGDYIKLLVNEAIVTPGQTVEIVKEAYIEDSGHEISTILKGQIGSINFIQNTVALQHSYTLHTDGWRNYQQIRQLSFDNNTIEYYHDGTRISLDYVRNNLTHLGGDVYIALEESFGGETISKLTFRSERDQEVDPDLITAIEGGNIVTASGETIEVDNGTIIRKNGNLVNVSAINMNDYVYITLNGDGRAAVLDVDSPEIKIIPSVGRVRVASIIENKSFTTSSISILQGDAWQYSPIQRTFTIDEQTLFMREDGIQLITSFIGYTDDSSIDRSFTIVYEGDRVTHLVENDYPQYLVSGTIYEPGTEMIQIKDAKYLDEDDIWQVLSIVNPTIDIAIAGSSSTLVMKDNKVVSLDSLQANDQIVVYVMEIPEEPVSGMEVEGVIIFVTN